jgi:phosphoribosylformimino-5-aminoimidazole carboxamide ribotide isomerase
MMELFPAIDVRGGGAVRLTRGDFDQETRYGDPLALARRYVDAGVRWIHVVDLDAARTGEAANRETVLAIAELAGRSGVAVQSGGGVRTDDDVDGLLGAGVRRVVLGTAAMADPELARRAAGRHPGGVAVGVDYRVGHDGRAEPAVRGWREGSGLTVSGLLDALDGSALGAVVVTSIERDGTLSGPDLGGLTDVLDLTSIPVVASGGVGSLDDIVALATLRSPVEGRCLAGVVVGKALVDGRIGVEEAMAACERSV